MKDDTSQGKKSQRDDHDFLKDEEDVDFEILDALEQLENAGLPSGEDLSGDDSIIELTVDDDDLVFGKDNSAESGGFSFDTDVSADLEEELLSEDGGENFDASFSSDLLENIQATADEAFLIDLNEEGVSIHEDVDLDLDESELDMSAAETLAFKFNHEQTPDVEIETPEYEEGIAIGEYDVDFDHSPAEPLDEAAPETDPGGSLDENDFELGKEEFSEEFDLARFDSENEQSDELDLGGQEIEIEKEFSDLKDDIDLDFDEFQGKTVISVGDDEVIDLGDENELERDEVDIVPELPERDTQEDDSESITDLLVEPVTAEDHIPSDAGSALYGKEEEEPAGNFIQSLGDIDIDLEEDVEREFEALAADDAISDDMLSVEDGDGAEVSSVEEFTSADLESEAPDTSAQEVEHPGSEPEIEGEEELREPEIDVREFLGLTLRLDDAQVQTFETMIAEAETLQQYLEELDKHQENIKENIFHKLHAEYIARKTVIFKSSDFKTLLVDVEQDLHDMLQTQAEFAATLGRMNEELEEIEVRHLVGEYDGGTLAEKEQEQRTDIAVWNEKARKIADIIARYQKMVDAEQELNPIRQEEEQEKPIALEVPSIEKERDAEIFSATESDEAEGAKSTPFSEEEEPDETSEVVAPESEDVSEAEFAEDMGPEVAFEESEPDFTIDTPAEEDAVEPDDGEEIAGGELYSFGENISGFDSDFSLDGEFELNELSGLDDEEEALAVSYELEAFAEEEPEEGVEQGGPAEDTVSCKKCGRSTPADQKFCMHCGGKAQ